MPQARLPDINAAFTKYRNEAVANLKGDNYTFCIGSLYALNGLLPDKYRVKISDYEYAKQISHRTIAVCNKCHNEIDFKDIKILNLLTSGITSMITGKKTVRVWVCQACKAENDISRTPMIKEQKAEPYFLRVVPKPPQRRTGLAARTKFHNSFVIWAETLLIELEAQMAQFRDDNWQKGGETLFDIDTNIEVPQEEKE